MIINQYPQQLQYTNSVVYVQEIESYLLWKSLPIRLVSLQKAPQNILESSSYEEILLFDNQFLNPGRLVGIFGVWCASDLFTFFPYLDNVVVLINILQPLSRSRSLRTSSWRLLRLAVELFQNIKLILPVITAKHWQSTPKSYRDCIECIISSILRVIGQGPYLFCINPLASSHFQTVDFLIHFHDLSLQFDTDCEIKSLNF